MKYRTRFRKYDFNKIYICLILVLVCFIGIGYSIIQSKPKLSGTAKIAAYIPMAFANQTKTSSPSASEQNISITDATGGSGRFIYTEKSEKNSSNVDTSYFTINSKNIVVAPNTPKDTYTYVITATDTRDNLTIDATYTINIKNDFANDSWTTIVAKVQSNPNSYDVGDTKEVDMGSFGIHTVRIANTSTPAECSTTGFSQTACGVVIEFADIITTHNMNSSSTTVGGWPATSMREYINSDIYDALPSELRSVIVPTKVISGHGNTSGETNFESTDKLYLLSTHEVWEDDDGNPNSGIDYYDTAYHNTRQLDYYSDLGVTTSNYSGAIKKNGTSNSWWWLRSARPNNNNYFYGVSYIGSCGSNAAGSAHEVSPAFRIG